MAKFLHSALLAAAIVAAPASAANLIVNGDFETFSQPIPAGYYNFGIGGDNPVPADFGWSVPVNNVDVVSNGAYGPNLAAGGSFNLDLVGYGSTGDISQTFTTVAGLAYTVKIFYAKNNGAGSPMVNVLVDGNTIGSFTGTSQWRRFSTSFIGTGAPTVFTISSGAGGGGNAGAFLDNISVTGVPEPSTWAMLLSGFGLVGFASRVRRKTANA